MFQNLISADSALHILTSFLPVMMTMVGGVGSFFGPIAGAGIFQVIEELTSRYTDRVELVMGLILILVIMFAPLGFAGLMRVLNRWTLDFRACRPHLEKTS